MIRIQENLKTTRTGYLESLAEDYWSFLNPTDSTDKFYKSNSLVGKIFKIASESKTPKYRQKYANGSKEIADLHSKFYSYLLKDEYSILYKLITGKPNELSSLKMDFLKLIPSKYFNSGSEANPSQTEFGRFLTEDIFDYNSFRKKEYCRSMIINIGMQSVTCPYCNDTRINIVDISNESDKSIVTKAYLDLDHFYPKAQNPFFALSFFNLIPCCHSCNSTEKSVKPFTIESHINPYDKSFDENYIFKINPKCLLEKVEVPIILEHRFESKDRTAKDLRIQERYRNSNYEEAMELLRHYQNTQYLGFSEKAIDRESFENAILLKTPKLSKEIMRKQSGKLFRDILKDFDVHNIISY